MLNLRNDMNVYEKIQAFEEQTKLEKCFLNYNNLNN